MPIAAGKLDKRITIQQRTVTRGTAGGVKLTWADVQTVWAEKVDESGSEFRAAAARHGRVNFLFRIRWWAGLSSTTHRIVYNGQTCDILHVGEENRGESQLVPCVFTEGAAS